MIYEKTEDSWEERKKKMNIKERRKERTSKKDVTNYQVGLKAVRERNHLILKQEVIYGRLLRLHPHGTGSLSLFLSTYVLACVCVSLIHRIVFDCRSATREY